MELSRRGPLLIAEAVYLNHRGPFRMVIDTGSASSSVPRAVAQRIGLRPSYAVEQVTPAGTNLVAASLLDEVKAGPVTRRAMEVLILDSNIHAYDGILGQNWLAQSDYLLDYCHRRLVVDPDPPAGGVRLTLHYAEGRPAVAARVGGRPTDLVLDSGAETLVLFGSAPTTSIATILTANGPVAVRTSKVNVEFAQDGVRTMQAVFVSGSGRAGLLPLAGFSAVYVSHRNGVVVLMSQNP